MAADQVHCEVEQEPAAVPAISQVVHQQPDQGAGILASARPAQQQEQEDGPAALARLILQQGDSEGESALNSEECGTPSDRSGMGFTTIWTAAQVKRTNYP